MLKLDYSEDGLLVECLTTPVERFIQQRVTLSVRSGKPIVVQPGTGCLLLPAQHPLLLELKSVFQSVYPGWITPADAEFSELTLPGWWIAQSQNSDSGILAIELAGLFSDQRCRVEAIVYELWKAGQPAISTVA
ncbi:alr0857 family protein [Leptolyngbya sp. AN03gr2]|uniref:alr0857 family protein n=1 Tax=unclassified Leptolyngbya TaxID=2650499 RepID=UPI003D312C8E